YTLKCIFEPAVLSIRHFVAQNSDKLVVECLPIGGVGRTMYRFSKLLLQLCKDCKDEVRFEKRAKRVATEYGRCTWSSRHRAHIVLIVIAFEVFRIGTFVGTGEF